MTAKHYEAFALMIRQQAAEILGVSIHDVEDFALDAMIVDSDDAQYHSITTLRSTALRMAGLFSQDNPRFQRDRFLAATGLFA